MKIAFCLKEDSPDSPLDGVFGRCAYFGIYDESSDRLSVVANEGRASLSGAGVAAVSQIANAGVSVLIAPEVGPKAFPLLKTTGITPFRQGNCQTVSEAYQRWKEKALLPMESALGRGLHRA